MADFNAVDQISICLPSIANYRLILVSLLWLVLFFQSGVISGRQQEFFVFLLLFVNKLPLPSNCTCCAGNCVAYNSTSTWGDNGETAKYPGRKVCHKLCDIF